MSTPSAWSKLDGARLSRAGAAGGSRSATALRVSLILVVGAGAWLAWSAFRPLPEVEAPAKADIPAPIEVDLPVHDAAQSTRAVARLGERNRFAPEGTPWVALANSETGEGEGVGQTSDGEQPAETIAALPIPESRITITPDADVPDDVRGALGNLELRGVYRSEGGPVAMIGFVSANPGG